MTPGRPGAPRAGPALLFPALARADRYSTATSRTSFPAALDSDKWTDRFRCSTSDILLTAYNHGCMMMGAPEYCVEVTEAYEAWWRLLALDEKESVGVVVRLLRVLGPRLPFPYSSGVKGSAYRHMRELRVQHRGRPLRILYAFDPRRTAILLLGGDKTDDGRWYERSIPRADRLYESHLRALGGPEQDPK